MAYICGMENMIDVDKFYVVERNTYGDLSQLAFAFHSLEAANSFLKDPNTLLAHPRAFIVCTIKNITWQLENNYYICGVFARHSDTP